MNNWQSPAIHHTVVTFCSNSSYQICRADPLVSRYQYEISTAEFICHGKQKIASLYVQRLLYSVRLVRWVSSRPCFSRDIFLIWPLFVALLKISNDDRKQKGGYGGFKVWLMFRLLLRKYTSYKKNFKKVKLENIFLN